MKYTFLTLDFSTFSSFCAFFAWRFRVFAVNCMQGLSWDGDMAICTSACLELEKGFYVRISKLYEGMQRSTYSQDCSWIFNAAQCKAQPPIMRTHAREKVPRVHTTCVLISIFPRGRRYLSCVLPRTAVCSELLWGCYIMWGKCWIFFVDENWDLIEKVTLLSLQRLPSLLFR